MTQSTAIVEIDEELWFGTVGDDKELEERASQSMAAVAARVLGAKPFPAAARKLEELTRDGSVKIEQVVGVLESDPGLSMRLLRLVNSAGYALRVRCTSVRHAAALVGMRRLHQLATTAAVLDLFETDNPAIKSLLGHAAVVGAFCRYLAVHVDLAPDELFTCGFLHDIGKLMLIDAEGEPYLELVQQAGDSPDALHLLEQAHFGFDHAVLGAHVLKNWRIPNPVPRVVAWHHNAARAYQADPTTASMVQTLRLADQLSYLVRTHPGAEGVTLAAQSPAASYLAISEAQLSSLWGDLTRLSQRITATPGSDQASLIPREDSIPPSMRGKKKRGKSVPPVRSLPPGTFSAPPGFEGESAPTPSVLPTSAATVSEMPKAFVCVVCNRASFGNRCPVCSGHVCAQHQVGPEQWCTDCAKAYRLDMHGQGFPMWERLTALGIVVGAGVLSVLVAVLARRPVVGALVGSTLLAGMCVTLVVVGRRFLMKRSFRMKRGHVVEPDQAALPLGLSMPPEPAIAVRDDLGVRPTVLATSADLPALFSVAPTPSESIAPASVAVAPPPPSEAPLASLTPAAALAPSGSLAAPAYAAAREPGGTPESVIPPDARATAAAPMPSRTIPIARPDVAPAIVEMPAPEASPFVPSIPLSERFSSPAPAHTLIGLQPSVHPVEPAPTVPARRRLAAHHPVAASPALAAVPAPAAAADPLMAAAHEPSSPRDAQHSELPEAPGWRPVERTEPASPNSKIPAELRRLSEAVPPLPPAPVVPAIEEPPPSVVESEPPPRAPAPTLASASPEVERAPAPRAATLRMESPQASAMSEAAPSMKSPAAATLSEAAPSIGSPVASLRPESIRSALAAPVDSAPDSSPPDSAPHASQAEAPSDAAPLLPEDSGIFVAAACKAVAPSMLVACRPASLKPNHYACSRLA